MNLNNNFPNYYYTATHNFFYLYRWQKELKRIQEAVTNLNNARALYKRRQQEYERCREALRIAEQGAEIGATGENKVR